MSRLGDTKPVASDATKEAHDTSTKKELCRSTSKKRQQETMANVVRHMTNANLIKTGKLRTVDVIIAFKNIYGDIAAI